MNKIDSMKAHSPKPSQKIHLGILAGFSLLYSASALAAGSIDVDLSNDAVNLAVLTSVTDTKLLAGGSFLHHEDNGEMISGSVLVAGKSKASLGQQTTGLGAKAVVFRVDGPGDDPKGGALALGGFIHHTFENADLLSVRGDFYYGPSVVNFGDSDRYLEYSVRVEYALLENANVYLGYRKIDLELDNNLGSGDLEKGAHLGINLQF